MEREKEENQRNYQLIWLLKEGDMGKIKVTGIVVSLGEQEILLFAGNER